MIRKTAIYSFCLFFLLCFTPFRKVQAVTANPHPVQYTQPDGKSITLLLKGDEFIHWAVTTDVYTVVSAKNGFYEYARIMPDGKLGFSGIAAHDPAYRTADEKGFVSSIRPGLFFTSSQIGEMKEYLNFNRFPSAPATGTFPTTGVRAHLMILANFSNTSTTYSQTQFTNMMNEVNYNNTGSFLDYYLEVSYGLLTVNTTVTIWVTLPHPHDYYGPQSMWGTFAYDAVVAANTQAGVDYSLYDNDGDGNVDGVCIAHQGRGQEESGNTNDIWSHSWSLSATGYSASQRTFDGVKVDDYTTIPEKGNSSSMTTIGVMCHEFGHNLGTPDFYDTDYNTGGQYDGTGDWDIMAGGSWNGSPAGSRPAHHNPWTKCLFTWTNPVVLSSHQTVLLREAELYPDVVRYNTTTSNEYFLCENRQKENFDQSLPGHGMIIYHVDGNYISSHSSPNNINAGSHQGMYPMSAISTTANGIMTSGSSNINSGGCPWPGTHSKTAFTDTTVPCSKSWAGNLTDQPLINITEDVTTKEVSFCFISCNSTSAPTNFSAAPLSSSQIVLSWTCNAANDTVMLVCSQSGIIGSPVNGTVYPEGSVLPGGGTVLYTGTNNTFDHTALLANTAYYYEAWSVSAGSLYSTGITTNATTLCDAITTIPYEEGFSDNTKPSCWSQTDHVGNGEIWQFGRMSGQSPDPDLSGNYAFLNSNGYGSGNSQNADLVSPPLDLTGLTNTTLQFNHYFKAQAGSSGTVSYSTDNGSSWTDIQVFTSTSDSNPETFSKVIPALDGQTQVLFRWNYTGSSGWYWAIDDVLVSEQGGVGISENSAGELRLDPNPGNGLFCITIQNGRIKDLSVIVFDISGRSVFTKECKGSTGYEFDLQTFAKGEYLVSIRSGQSLTMKKLIIQ